MEFVKAKPNEYLIVAKAGKIKNLGVASSAFLWPSHSYALVPSTNIEAEFAMTQETKDGIALRFKGIVVYHISKPEISVQRFDFSEGKGELELNHLIANVCLGELRDTVSHMSMEACVNERKTTLTDSVAKELKKVVDSWGVSVTLSQVAQVYIVEDEIRKQLEAKVRNSLRASSELSAIKTEEEIYLESSASKLRLKKEEFENEKERMKLQLERKRIEYENSKQEMALETPLKIFEAEQDMLSMQKMIELYELKEKMNVLKAKANLAIEIEENGVRKSMIELEQVPQIAESVSKMFNGANLSFYKDSSDVMAGVTPMMDMLARSLQGNSNVQSET